MKAVMTYKSGKFYFTDIYDQNRIANLLWHAEIEQNTMLSLPVLPVPNVLMFARRLTTNGMFHHFLTTKEQFYEQKPFGWAALQRLQPLV